MTYYEIEAMVKDLAEKDEVVKIILENICGDGYDAYARAYEIIKAIDNRPPAYDVDKIVGELEKYQKLCFATMANTQDTQLDIVYEYVNSTIQEAIDIVRREVK